MMIEKIKKIKYELIVILLFIIFPLVIYSITIKPFMKERAMDEYVKDINEHRPNSFEKNMFVTGCYPIMRDVTFIGDSYTYFLAGDLGFDFTCYERSGHSLSELKEVFELASKSKKTYANIFIGPNDFFRKTNLEDFKKQLKSYIDLLRNNGFIVIISTYMHCILSDELEKEDSSFLKIDDYNKQILSLIDENNQVYYLDIKELQDYDKYSRINDGGDQIHFNYDFNAKYISMLYDKLMFIRKRNIERGYFG